MQTDSDLCSPLSPHSQLAWAIISSLLTIHLTASNSFVTRKDSGVLGPLFAGADEAKDPNAVQPPQKRGVMYYVRANDQPPYTIPEFLHRLLEVVYQRSRRSFRVSLFTDISAVEHCSQRLWVFRSLLLRDCR